MEELPPYSPVLVAHVILMLLSEMIDMSEMDLLRGC